MSKTEARMTDSRYSRRHGFLAAIFDRVLIFFFRWTNRFIAWHRLPRWLGVANLIALRVELRQHNLFDTDGDLTHPKESCPFHPGPGATTLRTPTGTLNDLSILQWGAVIRGSGEICRRSVR